MIRKRWSVPECDKDLAAQIAEDFGINPFTAYLLTARKITDYDEVEEFMDAMAPLTENPFSFAGMREAAERIEAAIDAFERIAVYGDYDADGVTATALLYSYLEMREADVIRYIPDRMTEGYGLNCDAVKKLAEQGVKLIVTVDTGVSAIEEAKLVSELGMELIVTDHHKVGDELPQAVAVVDPHREDCPSEFKELSGVGVAFKLVSALEGGDEDYVLDEFGDLAALGTIGDVVLLKGENRALVRNGLKMINDSPRLGISALLKKAGAAEKQLTATGTAFTLCPRINAAGRMGSAYKALDLLLCDDEQRAEELAEEIQAMNVARQKTETDIFNDVNRMIAKNPSLVHGRIIVVDGEGWHQGVIGIVASRIVERFGKPAIVISRFGDDARGSCRSIEGFSIFEAIESVGDCLHHFGGHTLAAGIGLESRKIEEFRKRINEYAAGTEMPFPVQKIDCRINPASLGLDILDALDLLEPFGQGNPQPCFGLFGMKIEDYSSIGDGRHMRMVVSKGSSRIGVVCFGMQEKLFPYFKGDYVDLAVNLDRNVFNGETKVSVSVRNIRPSHTDEEKVLNAQRLFEKVLSGEPLTAEQAAAALPEREHQIKVFTHIKNTKPVEGSYEQICLHLGDDGSMFCKTAVTVEIMTEMGIIAKNSAGRLYAPETDKKVNLNDSSLMKRINSYIQ